jgi:hypothetical protein
MASVWPFLRWSRSYTAAKLRLIPLLTATLIWAGVVLFTIAMIVPLTTPSLR